MSFRRLILLPLAFSAALFAYLSLEKLTGGNPALFRTIPKPFVAPPLPRPPAVTSVVRPEAATELPDPPELVPAAPPPPVLDWAKLPAQPPR